MPAKKSNAALLKKAHAHYEIAKNTIAKAHKLQNQKARQPAPKKQKNSSVKGVSTNFIKSHTKLAYNELCERLRTENTVNSLKVIASVNGVKGYSNLRKDELCSAIAKTVITQ